VALSSTAWAANGPLAGINTVGSADIINKEVKRSDLALDAVNSSRVAPGSLSGSDIANGSLGAGKLGTLPAARLEDPVQVRVNPPQEPCLYVTPTIQNAEETALGWDVEVFDNRNMHTLGCGPVGDSGPVTELVAPRGGLYAVSAGIIWSSNSTGSRELILKENATDYLAAQQAAPSPGSDATIQNVSTLVRLSAGDYVQALVWQDITGGGVHYLGNQSDRRNFFAMNWVGP
jgi:hypothetical protein